MEPAVEDAPVRVRGDRWLAAAIAATALVEVVVRDDVAWRPVALAVGITLALATLWRRTRPLAMVALAFGAFLVVDLATLVAASEPVVLYAGGAVVVLVYSLFRWGRPRQVVAGLALVLVEWAAAVATEAGSVTDAAGGLAVLLFAAALGVAVRYRRIARTQQLDGVRLRERAMLARELHDTVAHHVSAIAIQAQAGRVHTASRDLDGAAAALAVIEAEASRSLAEMRSMVGALRRVDHAAEPVTQRGVVDIEDLATAHGASGPRIDVERRGDLDDLRPSVQAALYRVAQEGVTNARRHARQGSSVHVLVAGDTDTVAVSVSDDGERGGSTPRLPGYGLVGMAERVGLLGGSLEAGPRPDHGWTVRASIPRRSGPA